MKSSPITVRNINISEKEVIAEIADIHVRTFEGFFLTFLGKGFLKELYQGYCEHTGSGLIGAEDGSGKIAGFLAYSEDLSGLYKYLIEHRLVKFAWYSLCAFFREPKALFRLIRAFNKPSESKREEEYVELASIGVSPESKGMGIGSVLIDELKSRVDFKRFAYISLETDADNNESVNKFYQKNGFRLAREYTTAEGRRMNEYRFSL